MIASPPGCNTQSKSAGCRGTVPADDEYSGTNFANIRPTALLAQYGIARSRTARGPVRHKSDSCYLAHRNLPLTGFMHEVAHMAHGTRKYSIIKSEQLEFRFPPAFADSVSQ